MTFTIHWHTIVVVIVAIFISGIFASVLCKNDRYGIGGMLWLALTVILALAAIIIDAILGKK